MYHCGGWRVRPERRGVVTTACGGIGFFSGRSCGVAGPSLVSPSSALAVGVRKSSGGSLGHPSRTGELWVGDFGRCPAGLRCGSAAALDGAGSARLKRPGPRSCSSMRRKRSLLRSACRPRSASVSSSLSPNSSLESSRGSGAGRTSMGESGYRSPTGESRRFLGGGDLGGDLGGVPGGVLRGDPGRVAGPPRCGVAGVACD